MTADRRPLHVLDLFSGPEPYSWSVAFRERGDQITTLDLDPRFGADLTADILTVNDLADLEERDVLGRSCGRFDVVLASPPCESFSVASIGTHWRPTALGYEPQTAAARIGLRVARHTFDLVARYAPDYYVIENPRGMLRKVAPAWPSATVWYCQYGDDRAKPTDLWTNVRAQWRTCANGNPDHIAAPRGARTGTQGRRSYESRSLIPYGLSSTVATVIHDEEVSRDRAAQYR